MSPARRVAVLALALTTGCSYLSQSPGARGRPSGGWLSHGVRLPDRGRGWQVLRGDAQGGQHWGTARVVGMVREVARSVYPSRGGVPLVVGDISAIRGGQIPHHASHRAGRDVDLLFFARDAASGEPVVTPEFVHYDPEGNSLRYEPALRFDTARNWDMVAAITRAGGVGVTRVFVATWIEHLLVEHARSRGVSSELLSRAESVMHQPGDSAPHDDHFHVRVVCTPDERALGCVDSGPSWTWNAKDWDKGDSASADDATVLEFLLGDGVPDVGG